YENGTANGEIPLNTGWIDAQGTISQCIIPASELGAMTGGSISQMQFYIYQAGQYGSIQDAVLECSLGEVATTTITSAITTGLTPVWSGNLDFSETNLTVTFTTPYQYNGGNLLISFEVVISSGYTGYTFYGTSTNYQSCFSNQYISDNQFLPKTTFTYTGGSSCIAPTGLAASNITAEGATISWNDNGAESYNLDVNGTVYENVTNPYILDVELSTTYTVKVQAVCGENETSAWSSAINFTTPDCWDGHTINYTLTDSYGDGWNGAYLTIVDKSNNNTIKTLTLSSGRTESGSLTLCSGTYDFVWHKGSYDSECSFSISENGETLFTCYNASVYTNGQVVYTLDLLEKFSITLTHPSEEVGTISADLEEATAGTTVTLSANFNLGYTLDYFMVDGVQIEGNTFEMPEHDVTVSVAFNELTQYAISCAELAEGTIHAEYEGETITQAPAGTEVILVAEPNAGYVLDHFVVDDEPLTGNTFEMPSAAVNVSAVFSVVYSVTVDPQLVGGTIAYTDLTSATAFAAGTTVYLTPQAYTDYVFVDNSIVATRTDNSETVAVNYNPNMGAYYIEMPASNVTVTATFNAIPYYNVTKDVTPMYSGYYDVSKTSHIAENEQIAISNINPATGYEFGSVVVTRDDNGNAVETSLYQGSYYFDMPNSDVTVTVTFNALPRYSVSVGEVVNGTITVDEPFENILAGTPVYFSATPATDYVLESLSVKCDNEDQTDVEYYDWYGAYRFYMPSSNVTISATFRQLQTYTINYYVNGELDRTMQCREDGLVNNDGPQNVAVPAGMTFEGWGVAEIGTYVTEKPAVLGNAERPTQNYDLYAVLSYSESVPAGSKDGETWVEVTSPTDLSNGDHVIFVEKNNLKILAKRTDLYDGNFRSADVTISSNEINSIPSNAIVFEADNTSGSWKFKFEDAFNTGLTTLADYYGGNLVPLNMGWGGSDSWTIISNGTSVNIQGGSGNYIVYKSGDFTVDGSSVYKKSVLFKKYNPVITTNYYMTSVLTGGTVADATVKNIIVVNPITVSGRLEMNANGLFRNENVANFVFADGAEFYYTGEETVLATFQKSITGYTNTNDHYYLIANPTDNETVANLVNEEGYDLYTFDGAADLEWINMKSSPVVANDGIGYLYANSSNVTLGFAGEIIPAGSTDINLNYANKEFGGFNLIGNPFACNAYVGKSFYVIQGTELTLSENAYVAPCEGFFVEAAEDDLSVTLSTTVPAPTSLLSLTVSQNRGNVIDRAIVRFDGANDLHKFMLNPDHTNIRLAKHGEEFAAISSEAEGEIPVSFKAEKNGSYTITVNTENVNAHYIHLIDNKTGMDVDLLATPSYTFNASTSDYAYRFKLVFSMTGVEENESNANSYAYINNGNLVIDHIEGEATMQIVDMLGRVVSTEIVSGSYNKALNLKAGLYIINLNGMTQKIVVK
ncbi:MAG: T9SS type A sorting domain-containing protein, partial [Bacteroidales bacterium]|nr:T9SS type A sorting domain-containing protein [Bacteroidales bacterium]